jgi:hypothetical protein
MDVAVKELWVSALRSGEYVQGYGQLRTSDNKYCCLGVLCELASKQGIIPEASLKGIIPEASLTDRYWYAVEASYLPDRVQEWAGLSDQNPQVANADGVTSGLGNHNDSGSHDFDSIADMIEASL